MFSHAHNKPGKIRAVLVLILRRKKGGFKEAQRLLSTTKLVREQQSHAVTPGKLASSRLLLSSQGSLQKGRM